MIRELLKIVGLIVIIICLVLAAYFAIDENYNAATFFMVKCIFIYIFFGGDKLG